MSVEDGVCGVDSEPQPVDVPVYHAPREPPSGSPSESGVRLPKSEVVVKSVGDIQSPVPSPD